MLTDFVPMSSVTWVKNPDYWEKNRVGPGKGYQLPYLNSVKQLLIPDMSTRMAAQRTGKVDQDTTFYSTRDAKVLIDTAPNLLYATQLGAHYNIAMRLDKPEFPWAGDIGAYFPEDPADASAKDLAALKVRQALNYTINNQEMCDTLFGGEGEVISFKVVKAKIHEGIYTPLDEMPEARRKIFDYQPHSAAVAEAKQLLTEAGYPDGFKANVVTKAGDNDRIDALAMVKNYWTKIGVDLEIKPTSGATLNTLRLKRTVDQMFYTGRSSFNAYVMYLVKTGDYFNTSMVSDPKLDDYYLKMAGLYLDETKRDPMLKEMNSYLLDRNYYLQTPMAYEYMFYQPWLKNYSGEYSIGSSRGTDYYRYIWIDQEMRQSMVGR